MENTSVFFIRIDALHKNKKVNVVILTIKIINYIEYCIIL